MGTAQSDEKSAVDNWYHSFNDQPPVELTATERENTKQEIWNRIAPALVVESRKRIIPFSAKTLLRAAVVVGLISGLLVIASRLWHTKQSHAYTVIATQNGEQKGVTLPDGSRLTLNAGTTLYVYNDFSGTRRIDLVDGEVFFDVKRDTLRPFQIHNNDFTVSVLGTSFSVSAYAGLKKFAVGVVTGKVSVKKDTTTLSILPKDQQLVYNKQQQAYVVTAADESLLAWRNGRVLLNDVSFDEMAFLMKKHFGININTDDKQIANTTYTTELFTTMQPADAVEVLAAIHQLKIKKTQNGFLLFR